MEPEKTQSEIQQNKVSPKDVFLHLLAIIVLYVSVGSFITLIFSYINIYFPDSLNVGSGYDYYGYQKDAYYSGARWSISILIIMFPVYLLTMRFLNKSYKQNPSKRNLKIRKWLLYFTLFAAALIIVGDAIALIYNFLEGDLTIKFFLKILTAFLVAGAVFFYYLWDIKKNKTE